MKLLAAITTLAFLVGLAQPHTLGRTNWGELGPMAECAPNTYVNGFRIKVEPYKGTFGDDTALNAIEFHCTDGKILKSKEGELGTWKGWMYCPGARLVDMINFRSENDQGNFIDDSAGNNLNVHCTDASNTGWVYGEGGELGKWDAATCAFTERVCGLQTQVEMNPGTGRDDTALNKVTFKCCSYL